MMTQAEIQWSSIEKQVVQTAIKRAREREVDALIALVRDLASNISHLEDVWQLHDFLSARRHDIDGKYDDREAFLLFTLSTLIKNGLLESADLEGLKPDKRAKVMLLARM